MQAQKRRSMTGIFLYLPFGLVSVIYLVTDSDLLPTLLDGSAACELMV